MKRTWVVAALVLGGLAAPTPARAGSAEALNATGDAGPCLPTTVSGVRYRNNCEGYATLVGSLIGTIHFWSRGKVNVVSGNASGWITEYFVGRTDTGRRGTLWLAGPFVVDGTTGTVTAQLQVYGTSGDLRRARGSVDALGYMPITGGPHTISFAGMWKPGG